MKKWEYRAVKEGEESISEYGLLGWEMVSVAVYPFKDEYGNLDSATWIYFKRELAERGESGGA